MHPADQMSTSGPYFMRSRLQYIFLLFFFIFLFPIFFFNNVRAAVRHGTMPSAC